MKVVLLRLVFPASEPSRCGLEGGLVVGEQGSVFTTDTPMSTSAEEGERVVMEEGRVRGRFGNTHQLIHTS